MLETISEKTYSERKMIMETKDIQAQLETREKELKEAQVSLQKLDQQRTDAVLVTQRLIGAITTLRDLLPKDEKSEKS